ncbi:hypothetical protein FP2506_13139 [Fulvimarina pelagi HTCC2506]|uniref:DUF983 domain-containing protein n=2 Tax=Fulvimarina pelagi TaxID=217511 RepID=Q0G168_9HYPH|nr:DUF983 domain-containing protein [Fulvimarina pelagi]EAU41213.1 hypothetical protein FP2506_13139 [Fulvimarina pelagi HTCC2506]BAT30776.1 cytochrome c oxidase subunit III [Fulvimarina pelagi]
MSQSPANEPDPILAGLKGRCPHCGKGRLFSGFLKPAKACDECGLDYDFADSGDGPAVFVILIIGLIVCGLALLLEVTYDPPLILHLVLWVPMTVILALPLLRMLKGVMITLTYSNDAREGRPKGHGRTRSGPDEIE